MISHFVGLLVKTAMDFDGNVSDVSEDIFSDDEVTCDLPFTSPDARANSSFLHLSQTPGLFHRPAEETPSKAIVPKTPMTLAPFISKAAGWTSDLETPENKRDQLPMCFDNNFPSTNAFDDDVTQTAVPILTPPHLKADDGNDEIVPLSQELPPRKKPKRPPKRRIFDKNKTALPALSEATESDEETDKSKPRKSQSFIQPINTTYKSLKKLQELKEFQRLLRERNRFETLEEETISDDEFLKNCRVLEMCDRAPRRELNPKLIPSSQLSRNPSDEIPLSQTCYELEILARENQIQSQTQTQSQQSIPLTPVSLRQTSIEDNFSEIDFGVDQIFQEDDNPEILDKTMIMDDDVPEVKKEMCDIDSDLEDGFRGFTKEEQENKHFWAFQRMFVREFGNLSPKRLDFLGFSFMEAEIASTIAQNNDLFRNNYLEKYYAIRDPADPLMMTIKEGEPEEFQLIEDSVPVLHHLPSLLVSVYSGFDTASGTKLFLSVNTIYKEQIKLQKNEPTEMHNIDLLISSANSYELPKLPNSIRDEKNDIDILEIKSVEPMECSDESEDEIIPETLDNSVRNRRTSLCRNSLRNTCDNAAPVSPSLNAVKLVPRVVELGEPDNASDCLRCQDSKKLLDAMEESSSADTALPGKSGNNYPNCLNDLGRVQRLASAPPTPEALLESKVVVGERLNHNGESSEVFPHDADVDHLNTSYSPKLNDETPNDEVPILKTGISKSAQLANENVSWGGAIFTEAENEPTIKPISRTPNGFKPTMGFTTASGGSINFSEAVQAKIETGMAEFSTDLNAQDPNLELSTMRNKMWASRKNQGALKVPVLSAVNIQSKCLPVTKPLMWQNVDKPQAPLAAGNFTPTIGFTTAGGGVIKHSEAVLQQMKAGLEAYNPDVDENDPELVNLSSLKKSALNGRPGRSSDSIGNNSRCSTTPISRSKLDAKRPTVPLMSKPLIPLNVKRPEPIQSIVSELNPIVGFATARGSVIALSAGVQEKIKADLQAYTADVEDNDCVLQEISDTKSKFANLRNKNQGDSVKRKNPPGDVTPFGRKRARTATDLQARVFFTDINDEDEEIIQSSLTFQNNHDGVHDRDVPFKSTITGEIQASNAAFFANLDKNYNRPANRWSDISCPASSSRPIERRARSFPSKNYNEKGKGMNKTLPAAHPESIPDDIVWDSQDFSDSDEKSSGKMKLNEAVMQRRHAAARKQANLIQTKTMNRGKKNPGSLLEIKERDRTQLVPLRQLCLPGTSPTPRKALDYRPNKIDPAVLSITSAVAENYQFTLEDFYGHIGNCVDGVAVGDCALLIPNDHNLAGVTEFKRSFLASPGVDPTLVPQHWVENHYKWIIWKLASIDRLQFTRFSPPKYLTPDRVLKQLKYRYDREIDRAERPVLRKIMEKDSAPARRMILCVSRIKKQTINSESSFMIELTDGWYSLNASLDIAMQNYIISEKIKEGTKLMVYGAQLMNADEGCHPLEVSEHVRLKIHTNSTRRVKWYAKLGLQKYDGPMELSLSHIQPNGGLIGKVSAVVSRLYPIIYKEITADGEVIFRNARSEERAQISFNDQSQLSSLQRPRDVTPCLKLRITDGCANAMLTIWQNAVECSEMFKEGNSISIVHGIAAGKRSNELQINATRWTTFDVRRCKKTFTFPERIFTPLSAVMKQDFTPHHGEFDTVGIVVSVGPAPHGMKNFEAVNLAYRDELGDDSFLSILFWEGVDTYGYSSMTTIGSIICCLNCEWRRNTYRSIPMAFCSERTIITRNPRAGSHLKSDFDELKYRIGDTSNYVDDCAARIQNEIVKKVLSTSATLRSSSVHKSCDNTANMTPQNRRSAAAKSRLDKLQHFEPMSKLSPINLRRSSRASHDYKSPISNKSRTES